MDAPRCQLRALRAVAEHGTIASAAAALGLSPATIDKQLDQLRKRTGLRYLPQLVRWAAREGHLFPENGDGHAA